jgi:hypothetical protein
MLGLKWHQSNFLGIDKEAKRERGIHTVTTMLERVNYKRKNHHKKKTSLNCSTQTSITNKHPESIISLLTNFDLSLNKVLITLD